MSDEQRACAQNAVEVMTAWAGGGRSTEFLQERLADIGSRGDNRMEFARTFTGLVHVAGDLLVRLAQQTGTAEEELLQEMALRYQSQ